MECLNCGELVKQTQGKRAKLYCDANCRQKHWLRKNKKANPPVRGPGRPKNNLKHVILPGPTLMPVVENQTTEPVSIKITADKVWMAAKKEAPFEIFMGHEIPKGLKGIDLTIWKNEIKEKAKP